MTLDDLLVAVDGIDIEELRDEIAHDERRLAAKRTLLEVYEKMHAESGDAPANALASDSKAVTPVRRPAKPKVAIDESVPLKTRVIDFLRANGPQTWREIMRHCGGGPRQLPGVLSDAQTFSQDEDSKTYRLKRP
jgi:hypothetical protein